MLSIPNFQVNRLTDDSKAVSPKHRQRSTSQAHYLSSCGNHLCMMLSETHCLARRKGVGKLKSIYIYISFQRVSNPQPPALQHSAPTTTLPRAPIGVLILTTFQKLGSYVGNLIYLNLFTRNRITHYVSP
jgi:hypothetical protein